MEVKITTYEGKKNDLLIGLIKRWIVTTDKFTAVISMNKVKGSFEVQQWGMDKEGNDIESYRLLTKPFKKKYYAMQKVISMLKGYGSNYGLRKPYIKNNFVKK